MLRASPQHELLRMILTDSHCHLTMSDADAVLARAREAGIRGFVVPGTKLEDAPEAVAVAQKHDDVWAAVGFHPHEAKDCDDGAFAEVERLAADPKVVAIGECGLDYHYMHSPRETQISVFERHIALAKRVDKPIIVHNRESTEDCVDILLRSGARGILPRATPCTSAESPAPRCGGGSRRSPRSTPDCAR